jgi:hypothetical protein
MAPILHCQGDLGGNHRNKREDVDVVIDGRIGQQRDNNNDDDLVLLEASKRTDLVVVDDMVRIV